MKISKITIQNKDGSLHWIDGENDIVQILKTLPPKLNWKHTSNIERLHNKYFTLLGELNKNANTGYTKTDLHEAIKPLLFGKLTDLTQFFKDGKNTGSTKDLTYEGWNAVIEQLKVVANDIFNYTFK